MERRARAQRRRLAAAVAVSLACHLMALWFLARAQRPTPRPKPHAPVPIEVRWEVAARPGPGGPSSPRAIGDAAEARAPNATPTPPERPAKDAPAPAPAQRPPHPPPVSAPPAPAPLAKSTPPPAPGATAPSSSPGEGVAVPSGDEARALAELRGKLSTDEPHEDRALTPSYGGVASALPAPEPSHGQTLHPEDMPSVAEQHAAEAARVGELVEGGTLALFAEARVKSGLVDPYFGDLRRELAKSIESAPDFTDAANPKNLPKSWASSWRTAAQNYGKSGVAFDAPVSRTAPQEIPSVLQQEIARGSRDAQALGMKLYAGARLRDFGQGKMGAELYAEVELAQGPTGALERLTLVRASGINTFDAWVVEKAATAVDTLGPLDAAAHPMGLRSVFAFTGHISYMRKVGDIKPGADAPYLIASTLLGMIPGVGAVMPGSVGTFDEVTGEGYYLDMRYPHYECQVKLLRVYNDAKRP